MKKLYILPVLAVALLATGCSKENPFSGTQGEGKFLKSALSMDINADGLQRRGISTRAEADINDFNIVFTQEGHSEPFAKYRYGDMPDVITLPAGNYICSASYGENRPAEWESPYFLGESESFEVTPYEICSYIDPISCTLENIKVTIDFDKMLRAAMSDDSYVEVKVGNSAALTFGLTEADSEKAGFFKHSGESTLVAVFHGKVNGNETVETKSLKNVEKGNHYKVTFKLHTDGDATGSGDADADVSVDASVNVVNVERNVTLGDDEPLDDNERPHEGDDDDPPTPPAQSEPVIAGLGAVIVNGVNNAKDFIDKGLPFVIYIESAAPDGISGFEVDIVSDKLDKTELQSVGLDTHLDLINPGNLTEQLNALGLLVQLDANGDQMLDSNGEPIPVSSYKGYKKIKFDLTTFLSILGGLGSDVQHDFVLTVTDANGSTTNTITIAF